MIRILGLAAFSSMLATAALAGPMPVHRLDARPAPRHDLVSANLNKLVFWHVPDRDEARSVRRNAD